MTLSSAASRPDSPGRWRHPVGLARYDTAPLLRPAEQDAIIEFGAVNLRRLARHDPAARGWQQIGRLLRPHPQFPFTTIRSYLNSLLPVLDSWAGHAASLREITSHDIQQALAAQPPVTARNLLSALHSLFRALKQEKLIFRDPTRQISLPAMRRLPAPIPADQLRGLIDRTPSPISRLVVALIAIHGLGKLETARLLAADLDLAAGRLAVRRHGNRYHTVYLDELTSSLAAEWLRERHRRWPRTGNPHLLITRATASDEHRPPVAHTVIEAIFTPLRLTPGQLRRDRILDEARHTADPVHLITVFGISAKTGRVRWPARGG